MKWISENRIYQQLFDPRSLVRVLWVPEGGLELVLYDVVSPRMLPYKIGYEGFLQSIDAGNWELCLVDPECVRIPADSELTTASLRARDERMEVIRELVEDPGRRVLDADYRNALFTEISLRKSKGRNYLYKYMRLWWSGGQVPNALAPRYADRGGPGKIRTAGASKRGRPVEVAGTTRPPGINITPSLIPSFRIE